MGAAQEVGPNTSGWLTTTPASPASGAFAGYQAGNTGTATWKYKTQTTTWPSSFSMINGQQDWSNWTGPQYTLSNPPFSSGTTTISLDQGDVLYVANVPSPGTGQVYLRRKAANDFVFYTNQSFQYMPTGRYDFSSLPSAPTGQFHWGEDAPQMAGVEHEHHRPHGEHKARPV